MVNVVRRMVNVLMVNVVVNMVTVVLPINTVMLDVNLNLVNVIQKLPLLLKLKLPLLLELPLNLLFQPLLMVDVVNPMANVHPENVVVNMVTVANLMTTVEKVVNPNSVNVKIPHPLKLKQPLKLLQKLKQLLKRPLKRLPQNHLFQLLLMINVVKQMVYVHPVNVVVNMVGVVLLMLIVELDVNANMESVNRL